MTARGMQEHRQEEEEDEGGGHFRCCCCFCWPPAYAAMRCSMRWHWFPRGHWRRRSAVSVWRYLLANNNKK